MALVCRRIATIYTAMVRRSVPPPYFGSLQDFVDLRIGIVGVADYRDDQAYWSAHLPPENDGTRLPQPPPQGAGCIFTVGFGSNGPGRRRQLKTDQELAHPSILGDHRGRALLVRSWTGKSSEVALDFPVSRRVVPETRTLPGMFAGVVPLVMQTAPESTVAEFCQHVDARIRELLQHQRFPVHTLQGDGGVRGPRQASNRVAVNFIPGRLTLDLAGVPATATYTNFGPMGHFGLFFLGAGDEIFLSTAGGGQPYANFEVAELAERLQRMLAAMAADPDRQLSSIDALGAEEHAGLDRFGNRAVLTEPTPEPISTTEAFAAQVARVPETVALVCGERSWTYRELDEASNRLANLLASHGPARESVWR